MRLIKITLNFLTIYNEKANMFTPNGIAFVPYLKELFKRAT